MSGIAGTPVENKSQLIRAILFDKLGKPSQKITNLLEQYLLAAY